MASQPDPIASSLTIPETEACRKFGDDVTNLLRFFRDTVALVKQVEGKDFEFSLQGYSAVLFELLHCRAVDDFLAYLSALLALTYRTRPQMLKSKQQVDTDFIFQFSSMDDLILALVDRRVQALAYKGLRDLNDFLEKELAFPLFSVTGDLDRAVLAVEIRNLFVHNRGIVNRRFKERVPEFPREVGESLNLPWQDVFEFMRFLIDGGLEIDKRAIEKFALPTAKRVPRSRIPDL